MKKINKLVAQLGDEPTPEMAIIFYKLIKLDFLTKLNVPIWEFLCVRFGGNYIATWYILYRIALNGFLVGVEPIKENYDALDALSLVKEEHIRFCYNIWKESNIEVTKSVIQKGVKECAKKYLEDKVLIRDVEGILNDIIKHLTGEINVDTVLIMTILILKQVTNYSEKEIQTIIAICKELQNNNGIFHR